MSNRRHSQPTPREQLLAHLVGGLKRNSIVAIGRAGRHDGDVGAVVPQIQEALHRDLDSGCKGRGEAGVQGVS